MKAELSFNSKELINKIAVEVVKAIKPLLSGNKAEDDNSLLSVESLAAYLSVSKQWVYERITLNESPFFKVGKFPRFKKTEIDAWLESQKVPAINSLTKKLRVIKWAFYVMKNYRDHLISNQGVWQLQFIKTSIYM